MNPPCTYVACLCIQFKLYCALNSIRQMISSVSNRLHSMFCSSTDFLVFPGGGGAVWPPVSSYLRVWVHWFLWCPLLQSLSLPASFPLPLSFSLPFSLSLSVSVPALLPLPVSVSGSFAVFPTATVVRGRLGAPLQGQVVLPVTRYLLETK